jgi:translocation and assembly module TamB
VLDRAYYLTAVKVGLTDLLRSALVRKRSQVAETDPLLATTQLGLSVRAPQALRVRNNLANLRGSADLIVRGTLATPVVFGRVEIDPGGTLVYADNDYRVERALLTFANPYRIEPIVDVQATTEIKNYDVTLNLSGTLERLTATFAADPPIADLEILSLLATGDASTFAEAPVTTESTAIASGGAEAFLAGQAASLIGERVNRLLGFDKFQVAPLQVGGDAVSSVRLTLGKRLGKNVYATYSVDPSGTLDQYLTLEWRVSPTVSLVLTQTGDGGYSVDARWEKAF